MDGQRDVDRVREATNLVALIGEHIPVQPKGREHVCVCPFHDDHRPSMSIVTHKGNAFYKCHACGAAGDAFNFVMHYLGKDFGEALQYLADRAGIALEKRGPTEQRKPDQPTRATLREVSQRAATFFRRMLLHPEDGAHARGILAERGIADEIAEQFNIGIAPDQWDALTEAARRKGFDQKSLITAGLLKQRKDSSGCYDAFRNRLIFPICDETGHPIAFGGRRIDPDDEPKYLNSSDSPIFHKSKTLYALHLARQSIMDTGKAIVTEGYTDVIACHQAGVTNVVGTLGTSLTRQHAQVLSRICDTVVMVFDGDEAGQRAADRAVEAFFNEPVDIRICTLPDGCDPDELLKREDGVEQFHATIESAQDALEYKSRRFRNELAAAPNLSARQKKLESFLTELANLGFNAMPGVRKRPVLLQLADLLGVPPHTIEQMMPRGRPNVSQSTNAPASSAPLETQPTSTPTTESDAAFDSSPVYVSRARRLAEHSLLSFLIYDPAQCAAIQIECDSGKKRICDMFEAQNFHDPSARRLAETIFPRLQSQSALPLQGLMSAIDNAEARHLASDLYFHAQQFVGDNAQADERLAEHVREAVTALQNRIQIEQYEQRSNEDGAYSADVEEATRTVMERIKRRSEQGFLPAAISQGSRG